MKNFKLVLFAVFFITSICFGNGAQANSVVCTALSSFNGSTNDASGAIQTCINSAAANDIVELPAGKYYVAHQIKIENRPITLRTQGKTASMDRCKYADSSCAELIATADILEYSFFHVSANNTIIDHIIFNGNKENRLNSTAANECRAGGNGRGVSMHLFCANCSFTNSVSKNALCGSGCEAQGKNQIVKNNLFAFNGTHNVSGLWADGITVRWGSGSTITDNLIVNGTDIDLVAGGCPNCTIANNEIRHTLIFEGASFAGLAIHNFVFNGNVPEFAGNYDNSLIYGNKIDCGSEKRCGFGMNIGGNAWGQTTITGGTFYNNTITNAMNGLVVYEAKNSRIYNNKVSSVSGNAYTKGSGSSINTAGETMGTSYLTKAWSVINHNCSNGCSVSANGADFVSQSVPTTMIAGKSYSVSVTMKNSGSVSWSEANGYRLGSQNPQDNDNWGIGRVALATNEYIDPIDSNTKKFTFTITAPSTPGTYNFQWQMVREGVEWFGVKTPNVAVAVSEARLEDPLPQSQFTFKNFFGANVHQWIPSAEQANRSIASAKKMHLNVIRLSIPMKVFSNLSDEDLVSAAKIFMDKAQANGIKVMIQLDGYTKYEGNCGYKKGFVNVRDTARKIVTAFKDHPALHSWDLLNEALSIAETEKCFSASDQASVIKAVAAMRDLVRSIDQNTPITVGESTTKYQKNWNNIINFASPHIYLSNYYVSSSPVSSQSLQQIENYLSNLLDKLKADVAPLPLAIGEFGFSNEKITEQDRAKLYQVFYKVLKQKDVGSMFWGIGIDNSSPFSIVKNVAGSEDVFTEAANVVAQQNGIYTCTPNSVSGCKVCNSSGTAWVDNDSKCKATEKCSNGICVVACTPDCTTANAKQCNGNGVQACVMSGGCLKWSAAVACASGKTCNAGICQTSCTPKTCAIMGRYHCVSWSDGCGKTISCGICTSGKTCSNGKCVTNCITRSTKKCDNGKLYWYNSCNTKEGLAQDCGTDQLTSIYRCNGSWRQRETIKKICANNACASESVWNNDTDCAASGKICSDGKCVTSSVSRNAQFVSQIVPASMIAGNTYSVHVTMKNTGTGVWTAADGYCLGTQNTQDNMIWGTNRVYLETTDSVATGTLKTFTFNVKAPSTPGTYNFQWQMVQEGVQWFGVKIPNVAVTVRKNSTCIPDCTTANAKQCSGNGVQTCTLTNNCLKWSAAVSCGTGKTCNAGICQTDTKNKTVSLTVSEKDLESMGCGMSSSTFQHQACRAKRWCISKGYATGFQTEWEGSSVSNSSAWWGISRPSTSSGGTIKCISETASFEVSNSDLESMGCGMAVSAFQHQACRAKRWCISKGYATGFQSEWGISSGTIQCVSGATGFEVSYGDLDATGCAADLDTFQRHTCRASRWCVSKGYATGFQSEWGVSSGGVFCIAKK